MKISKSDYRLLQTIENSKDGLPAEVIRKSWVRIMELVGMGVVEASTAPNGQIRVKLSGSGLVITGVMGKVTSGSCLVTIDEKAKVTCG